MGLRRTLTDKQIDRFIELYNDGVRPSKIAEELNITVGQVNTLVEKYRFLNNTLGRQP